MSHGRTPRGPIGRVSALSRVESADTITRVRATERVSGPVAIESRMPARTFAEALERTERGLGRSEPLPAVAPRPRALPSPERRREEDVLAPPRPLPESFLGLLWWKVKGRL